VRLAANACKPQRPPPPPTPDALPGATENELAFLAEDQNCTYFFEFVTSLACSQAPIPCQVEDPSGTAYDLTPLMNNGKNSNFQVEDPDNGYVYEFNLCRPLIDGPQSGCPARAGSCQRSPGMSNGVNAGLPSAPRWSTGDGGAAGHPYVLYEGGTPCNHVAANRSTRVDFVCPTNGEAGLEFVAELDCQYQFFWSGNHPLFFFLLLLSFCLALFLFVHFHQFLLAEK
jgi:hypothetical protein